MLCFPIFTNGIPDSEVIGIVPRVESEEYNMCVRKCESVSDKITYVSVLCSLEIIKDRMR